MTYARALCLLSILLGGCDADDAPDALATMDAGPADGCATPSVARWSGVALRETFSSLNKDNVAALVAWSRTGSEGCLDRYLPSGTASYEREDGGALCAQSVSPASATISPNDGELTIDRTVSPARYLATGSTSWTLTYRCARDGISDDLTYTGAGLWMRGSGEIAESGRITGTGEVDGACGDYSCAMSWDFVAE